MRPSSARQHRCRAGRVDLSYCAERVDDSRVSHGCLIPRLSRSCSPQSWNCGSTDKLSFLYPAQHRSRNVDYQLSAAGDSDPRHDRVREDRRLRPGLANKALGAQYLCISRPTDKCRRKQIRQSGIMNWIRAQATPAGPGYTDSQPNRC